MTDSEWDELLRLRDKASLLTRTRQSFTRLEDFIVYTRYIETYTLEEKEQLLTQFKGLTDQEKQDLSNRVANRTGPAFFHLSYDEVEKLAAARKELSFHERAQLLSGLILVAAGTVLLDLGGIFEGDIELDDKSTPERAARPYAYIYFSDGNRRRVETIDILESVKNDPTAIGHPAVVFAIYHWQRVIYTRRVIERGDVTLRSVLGRAFKHGFGGGMEIKSAQSNLKAVSETLYEAAEKRAIPVESALALRMQLCGLLGPHEKRTTIYKAWETMTFDFIKNLGGPEKVLEKLERELRAFEEVSNNSHRTIATNWVMEFLNDDGEEGGRRFVWFDASGNSTRIRWVAFRNAFAAWFFDLKQSSIPQYLKRAAKQNVVSAEMYEPSFVYPKTTVIRILRHLLTNPLITARGAVSLSEHDVGYHGIEEAIKEATSNTEPES